MDARFSSFSDVEASGAGSSGKARPTVRAYIKSAYARDQLVTILMDALDWGPFELINLVPDADADKDEAGRTRYAALFEIDSGAAKPNSRNHFEWGLMLLGVLDNHFRKDPYCQNNSYVVHQDHELARGVVAQGN